MGGCVGAVSQNPSKANLPSPPPPNYITKQFPAQALRSGGSSTTCPTPLARAPFTLQVLPQELAGRQFPPLRLENAEVADEDEDIESEYQENLKPAFDERSCMYLPDMHFHKHPLVRSGQVTVQELKQIYDSCITCLNTLLVSMPESFRESTFKGLCKRFNVPYSGVTGRQLKQAVGALVQRVLPSTVHLVLQEQSPSRCNSRGTSMGLPYNCSSVTDAVTNVSVRPLTN